MRENLVNWHGWIIRLSCAGRFSADEVFVVKLQLEIVLQNVLRELEQKKPQLDELVHTAENLKADSNRQQLHGKGESRSHVL